MKKINKRTNGGVIVSFFQGIAKIKGLPDVFLHENILDRSGNAIGIVIGYNEEFVEALIFKESFTSDERVFAGGETFSLHISDKIIGRTIDGLGNAVDDLGPVQGESFPVFRPSPQIIDRDPVDTPVSTGIKIIDTALPLGRGQRELIIGDRKLGKSTLALDVVLNQKRAELPMICVYVICGQKRQKLEEILNIFEKTNAFLYTVVVAATAGASFGELYLAPFVGCAIGEYFRDQGKDALVVYDDLSKHAKAYRDIALLLERAPGREAYPGDIFSLHAGLLERAAKLSRKKGGGSLTALPVIETQEGDISSFIPTNLISITDGQIYFERGLFQKGFLPAVNIGLSVSRIGSKAQPGPLKQITAGIRLALSQHRELQKLAQLETAKSEEAKKSIYRGELLLELLKQEKHTNITWEEQTVLFYTVEEGFFEDLDKSEWRRFEKLFIDLLRNRYFEILSSIKKDGFTGETKEKIKGIVIDFKAEFLS